MVDLNSNLNKSNQKPFATITDVLTGQIQTDRPEENKSPPKQ